MEEKIKEQCIKECAELYEVMGEDLQKIGKNFVKASKELLETGELSDDMRELLEKGMIDISELFNDFVNIANNYNIDLSEPKEIAENMVDMLDQSEEEPK